MKKTFIFLVLLSFIIGNISAQDAFGPNKRLKSGVWLKTGYDATFSNFLYEEGDHYNGKMANFGWDFQLGTTFYIGPRIADKLRFGLDVCWIDYSFFKLNTDYFQNGRNFFLNAFELGPIISVSPVKYIAFDFYARLVPSFSFLYDEETVSSTTTTYAYYGYHTNGLLGGTFRVGVFAMGLEYNFGKMSYTDTEDDANTIDNLIINNLRILLGFKF